MYEIRKATTGDIEIVLEMRYTTLRDVCGLKGDYSFDEPFKTISRAYFANEDHPTGKRAHVMNVYVDKKYRRQGIARKMMEMLLNEAKDRGVTEISLDATEKGRLLYEAMCFKASKECMVLNLR